MTNKATKKEADYRRGTQEKNCGNCVHMESSGKCELVLGLVAPNYVCDYWKGDKVLQSQRRM